MPIVPLYVDFDWCIRFNTWDRFTIPLPFSKARVRIGHPIWVLPEEDLEVKREELEEALFLLSSGKASERFGVLQQN
ncbi:MAG: hypothetical protein ABDH29_08230 [Aquificaceae bacterium]